MTRGLQRVALTRHDLRSCHPLPRPGEGKGLPQHAGSSFVLVLTGEKLVVVTVQIQQFLMPSLFHDLAALYHQNAVRIHNGGKPVGDHYGGAALDDGIDGMLDLLLQCMDSLVVAH